MLLLITPFYFRQIRFVAFCCCRYFAADIFFIFFSYAIAMPHAMRRMILMLYTYAYYYIRFVDACQRPTSTSHAVYAMLR